MNRLLHKFPLFFCFSYCETAIDDGLVQQSFLRLLTELSVFFFLFMFNDESSSWLKLLLMQLSHERFIDLCMKEKKKERKRGKRGENKEGNTHTHTLGF